MEKRLTIRQNALYNTIGSCFYLACQWLITVLVIRQGSVESGGILSLAMSVSSMFYTVSAIGRAYQVSDYHGKYETGEYVATRLFTCGVSMVLCIGYCTLFQRNTGYETMCILAYMGFRTVESMSDEYQAIQQTADRMDCIFWSFMMRGCLLIGSFSVVLSATKDVFWAICAMTAATVLVILIYDIPRCRKLKHYRLAFSIRRSLRFIADNIPLVSNSILLVCCVSIPRATLNEIWGNYTMGIYSSVSAPAAIIQNVAVWLFMPFVTELTKHYNERNREGFDALNRRILLLLGAAIAAVLIGAKLLGRWGLNLIFGAEIAEHADLLIPTLLTTVLIAIEYYVSMLLTISRFLWPMLAGNAAALALTLTLQRTVIAADGAYGVNEMIYLSVGTNLLIQAVALLWYNRRWFGKKEKDAE